MFSYIIQKVSARASILKNDQNTYYPRFSFIPKTGEAFPKLDIFYFFYCDVIAILSSAVTKNDTTEKCATEKLAIAG